MFTLRDGFLHISEGPKKHSVTPTTRAILNFSKGISGRGEVLRKEYFLDKVTEKIETIVDVGANTGDFMLALPQQVKKYFAFEPILEDYEALDLNAKRLGLNHLVVNVALGEKSGEGEIFVSTPGADSSAIEPSHGYSEKRGVYFQTLDDIFRDSKIVMVDLVKIEAEGFEPEIIRGGREALRKSRYVTVDGGGERGLANQTTIEECANELSELGFRILSLRLGGGRPGVALFRNKAID